MATTGVAAYSTTANSNTVVGGVSIAEGMSPASVNNAMRALAADSAVQRNLLGGSTTTGGSANAQTLTTGMTLAAHQQGLLIGFEAGYTNTTTTTLDVDSLGAKTVKLLNGANLHAGAITAGGIYHVAYESGADALILLNPHPSVTPTFTTPVVSTSIDLTGGQIAFPATQVPSAGANTLDDYEEGSFTPAIAFGGASVGVTYSVQTGTYTKIGRLVFFNIAIVLSSRGSSTGSVTIGVLPFTPSNSSIAVTGRPSNYTIGSGLIPVYDTTTDTISLRTFSPATGNLNDAVETQVDSNFSILLTGVFEV